MAEKLAELRKKGGGGSSSPQYLNQDFSFYTNDGLYVPLFCSGYKTISFTVSANFLITTTKSKVSPIRNAGSGTFDCTNYDLLYATTNSGASAGSFKYTA